MGFHCPYHSRHVHKIVLMHKTCEGKNIRASTPNLRVQIGHKVKKTVFNELS